MKKKIISNESKFIFKYFKNTKKWLFVSSIILIITTFIGIFTPILEANILTNITALKIEESMKFASLFVIITLISKIFAYLNNYVFLEKIQKIFFYNIRKDMIKNIFEMKTINYDKHSSGEFIERLRNDPNGIMSLFTGIQYCLFCILGDIFVVIYVFYLNYILGLIYLISIILLYLYEKVAFKENERLEKKLKKSDDKNSTVLNEIMRGIRDIKILNINNNAFKMVSDSLYSNSDNNIKKILNRSSIYNTIEVFKTVIAFAITFVGLLLVKFNLLTIASFLVIYMYRNQVYDLIFSYTSIKEHFVNYKVASKRMTELNDLKKYPKEKFGNLELENIDGKIELKKLSFKYEKNKVLDNVSLVIEPNDTIGIVGESGGGKTTLLNLLIKSYDVEDNKIFIDGIDINKLDRDSIRKNISIISQNPYIFNLTIKENLELMGDDISMKDIRKACSIAQIDDYINSLPKKYNTLLGEGGINLSGGQRQRLAIARVLLKKSKIILFDEATSALDNVTQKELNNAIHSISADYTIIIVAHRLSTIKECNKIYVMEKGKIVGSGTHKELINNNAIYQKLYNMEKK